MVMYMCVSGIYFASCSYDFGTVPTRSVLLLVFNLIRNEEITSSHNHRHSNSGPPFSSFGPSRDYGMDLCLEVYL